MNRPERRTRQMRYGYGIHYADHSGLWTYCRICVNITRYACFPLQARLSYPFPGRLRQERLELFPFCCSVFWQECWGRWCATLIGYFGGYPLVEKIKKNSPKSRKGLEASQQKYEKYAVLSVGGRLFRCAAPTFLSLREFHAKTWFLPCVNCGRRK